MVLGLGPDQTWVHSFHVIHQRSRKLLSKEHTYSKFSPGSGSQWSPGGFSAEENTKLVTCSRIKSGHALLQLTNKQPDI